MIFLVNESLDESKSYSAEEVRAYALSQVQKEMCRWKENDGAWQTDCGNAFCIQDGTPADNDMLYCCFCGKTILEEPKT